MDPGDAWGAAATVHTVGLVLVAGVQLAQLLLGRERCRRDALGFAVAALVAATAQAVLVAIVLGASGTLWFGVALPLEALLVAALTVLERRRARRAAPAAATAAAAPPPLRLLAARFVERLREHPFLAVIAADAIGSEALRGLLRPPLSWDSLSYHLFLAATWLQDHALSIVFNMFPTLYGYFPANGSLWLWWWMAPSHSELYVNLAFLPQCLLLGLATGGVARELGARRSWPLAAYLVLLCPPVVRFAATQYVDIFLAAMLVAAAYFGLLWMRAPGGDAAAAAVGGLALGVAAGTKIQGPVLAAALAVALAAGASGAWKIRRRQAALALLLAALLGSYFYLRNLAAGAGALARTCNDLGFPGPAFRNASVLANLLPKLKDGSLLDELLGFTAQPVALELGIGPQVVLLAAAFALPWLAPAGRRRPLLVLWSQILIQVVLVLIVPIGALAPRFAITALGLGFAGLLAVAEERGRSVPALLVLGAALLGQDLLMLHATMPRGVRVLVALADGVAAALALSPGLRARARRHLATLAAAAVAALCLAAPWLGSFRAADRTRALGTEYTANETQAMYFARAWGWLDANGDRGTVAVASNPANFFVYPAMGMRFERRALYVNVNRRDVRRAVAYERCDPRTEQDPDAWPANLEKLEVRWVLLMHFWGQPPPVEAAWAAARPDRFALRYADSSAQIYELLPGR
ncbi:MAG TPA: hypothetical protein VHG32_12470 [Thermoanaerobaculia bacterium]|jgi:hypothetical protein|nr:hypothetical protein [Thermoanaerobaculia bacterium]